MDIFLQAIESSQEFALDSSNAATDNTDEPNGKFRKHSNGSKSGTTYSLNCNEHIQDDDNQGTEAQSRPPPALSFEQRPPQWCIIDKWFTMSVIVNDPSIRELEAILYSNDGEVIRDTAEAEYTNDEEKKKIIVSADDSQRAVFKVRFTENSGNSGQTHGLLYVGIHSVQTITDPTTSMQQFNTSEKCLLKSPPIRVQSNRSKRPRESKSKSLPVVSSLSPNVVPSSGAFPGRSDRMLLIFGSNFYLWGKSPVVQVQVQNPPRNVNGHTTRPTSTLIEIKPPNLIWWSENLLECQLPELHSDAVIRVANYEMQFGDGKTLKVTDAGSSGSISPGTKGNDTKFASFGLAREDSLLSNNHISVQFNPVHPAEFIELQVRSSFYVAQDVEYVQCGTADGVEKTHISDIQLILQVYNRNKDVLIEEINLSQQANLLRDCDGISANYKLRLHLKEWNSINSYPASSGIPDCESLIVGLYLRKKQSGQYILDKTTRRNIVSEHSVFDDDEDNFNYDKAIENLNSNMQGLIKFISSVNMPSNVTFNDIAQIERIEEALARYIADVAVRKKELLRSASPLVANTSNNSNSPVSSTTTPLKSESKASLRSSGTHSLADSLTSPTHTTPLPTPNSSANSANQFTELLNSASQNFDDEDEEVNDMEEVQDSSDKSIAVPQTMSFSNSSEEKKQSLVYWKFFNPGTRTYLELSGGKLQIIGSRRIQMLIESVPPTAKFITANLYVQKNDTYEVIDNCARCKENGIPNVFCVLPRRGRENDYPWITFRITCTSTAKHWKGSPFWIGAEFLVDPATGLISKVYSPPIHVQSKIKSSEIQRTNSSGKLNLRASSDSVSNNTTNTISINTNSAFTNPQMNFASPKANMVTTPLRSSGTFSPTPPTVLGSPVSHPPLSRTISPPIAQLSVTTIPVSAPSGPAPILPSNNNNTLHSGFTIIGAVPQVTTSVPLSVPAVATKPSLTSISTAVVPTIAPSTLPTSSPSSSPLSSLASSENSLKVDEEIAAESHSLELAESKQEAKAVDASAPIVDTDIKVV